MSSITSASDLPRPAGRTRRRWEKSEDAVLMSAVTKAQEGERAIVWHEIAAALPGRTNKDCRKRWYRNTATQVNKGSWTTAEDEKLYDAVKKHGTKWSVVASEIGTRTGDQCSKRWNHTVNPNIDHSDWKAKEDEDLLKGIKTYGRNWQHIVSIYFPRRTSLGAKNRYNLLCRRADGARPYNKTKLHLPAAGRPSANKTPSHTDSEDDSSDSSMSDDENDSSSSYREGSSCTSTTNHLEADMEKSSLPTLDSYGSTTAEETMEDVTQIDPLFTDSDMTFDAALQFDQQTYGDIDPALLRFSEPSNARPSNQTSRFRDDHFNHNSVPNFNLSSFQNSSPRGRLGAAPASLDDVDMMMNTDMHAFQRNGSVTSGHLMSPPTTARSQASTRASSPSTSSQSVRNRSSLRGSVRELRLGQDPASLDLGVIGSGQETRRITIQAVCSADKLGTVVQAIMDLSHSAVFKTDV